MLVRSFSIRTQNELCDKNPAKDCQFAQVDKSLFPNYFTESRESLKSAGARGLSNPCVYNVPVTIKKFSCVTCGAAVRVDYPA